MKCLENLKAHVLYSFVQYILSTYYVPGTSVAFRDNDEDPKQNSSLENLQINQFINTKDNFSGNRCYEIEEERY